MTRPTFKRWCHALATAIAIALSILFATSPCAADPSPENAARAAELKAAGDAAMDKLRFADAVDAYQQAFTLAHDPAILYNLGRALEGLGSYPEALAKLEAFDQVAPADLKEKVPGLAKRIAEIRQRVTTLVVQVDVAGARILVRSIVVGVSPLGRSLRVTAGRADVEIEADGYLPFKKQVDLPGGGAATVDAHLLSKDKTGILVVHASAPGADVAVDGKRLGVAPVDTTLPAGEHVVVVRHPDFSEFTTSVALRGGERRVVDAELQTPRVFTRWWFWTGLGIAAVAGGTIGYVATKEKGPSTGTIPPGTIKVPTGLALTVRF